MAMAAISRTDLDRIVSSVNDRSIVGSCEATKKEQLKQLSDARVAGWTDTLANKRKAKLEWKAEKEREDEAQRKLQDAKDAARHQNVRMKTLEYADKLLWEQTEKLRRFRSRQMLVDTIDTRDDQLKVQKEKRKKESAMEELWHIAVMENIQKAEEKSKREIEKEKQRAMKLAEDLRKQRDEKESRIRAQQQRKLEEEAAVLKKIAMDKLAAKKAEMNEKNERRIKAKVTMEKNELLLKTQQEELCRKDLELTRKCEEDIAKRSRISAARAELEIKHFEEKQAKKKILNDRASEDLKQRALRECEIFERDVKVRNQKAKEKHEAARLKLEQERIAIDESRRQQLQCKVQDKEAEKKLGELYAKELIRTTTEQQNMERQKQLAKRKQNIELRKKQQQQIREIERRRAKEKADNLKEEQQVFHELKKEDDIFQDFVRKEIENFKVQGKRTALLEKTLNS